ncbi:MAG TPA: ABC transporter ATP-binding protein, partial [Brevundimonas sp.]|nr:ABC transporter ATP-binding protein [Brevundimonas sp.]
GGVVARLTPGDDPDAAVSAMNRALVEAGVAVFAIGARARSLEGIYRQASAPAVPAPQPELV